MRISSLKVRGLNSSQKRRAIRDLECKKRPKFSLQETKQGVLSSTTLRSWSFNSDWCFDFIPALGSSGGILLAWHSFWFEVQRVDKSEHALIWFRIYLLDLTPVCIINI